MWKINDYEKLVYSIRDTSRHIESANVVLQRRGKFNCWLVGTIFFSQNIRLEITEALDFTIESFIKHYSYTVYREDKRLYWYDSQGHPNDPDLQATHPHHNTSLQI